MGNFTINHYSALTVGSDQVALLYVLDMAEIPTYQELGTIRPIIALMLTRGRARGVPGPQAGRIAQGLALTVTGGRCRWRSPRPAN